MAQVLCKLMQFMSFAWRQDHERRKAMRTLRRFHARRTRLAVSRGPFYQKAMWLSHVWRRSMRVHASLRRSLVLLRRVRQFFATADSRAVYIVCVAARPGVPWVLRHPRTVLISCDAGRILDSVHQNAMWIIVWRGSTLVHARPRRSDQAIMRPGATRVLRGSCRSHAGPRESRVPRGSLAGPSRVHFTLRGPRAPFGFLKILLLVRRERGVEKIFINSCSTLGLPGGLYLRGYMNCESLRFRSVVSRELWLHASY